MATVVNHKTVTYEEWLNMPEVDEGREEVVNGEIIIMPPCKIPHTDVITCLLLALAGQLDRSRFRIRAASFGLVIRKEPLTCREPDLAVFDRTTVIEQDGYIHSAPLLVIEVLSSSENRRRKEAKLRDYESIGTPEVWLISPEGATVEIQLLQDGKLRRTAILAEGILKPLHLPGVEIDTTKIWPD